MKSIQQQFEHIVPDTGIDALYARHVLETIDGRYYFCPLAPSGKDDYFCSALFA